MKIYDINWKCFSLKILRILTELLAPLYTGGIISLESSWILNQVQLMKQMNKDESGMGKRKDSFLWFPYFGLSIFLKFHLDLTVFMLAVICLFLFSALSFSFWVL